MVIKSVCLHSLTNWHRKSAYNIVKGICDANVKISSVQVTRPCNAHS